MRDAYCSYKLAGLLQNAGFDFSGSGKLVNSRGEILPGEILGFAQACDGTEEATATLQSVRSWLDCDKKIKIVLHYSIPKDIYTSTIIRRKKSGVVTKELNDKEFKDYDDCLENAIIYVLECYFLE
jgi:hypothetical protein